MNYKEYLLEVKRLITDVGWHKGEYFKINPDTQKVEGYCLLGAISHADFERREVGVDVDDLFGFTLDQIHFLIQKKTGQPSIANFNDADTTTKEDVIKLLDELIGEQP